MGNAVLDVLDDEGLREHAEAVGARLLGGLRELAARWPLVGDVRGSGLFVGVELVRDPVARTPARPQAAYVVERLRERGILVSADGPDRNVLKLKPPLPFAAADADRLVEALDGVLGEDPLRVG